MSKQLATAQNTLEDAGKRTRAVERKLRDVETLDAPEADALLAIPLLADEDDEAA